jgi:hypothetical protein
MGPQDGRQCRSSMVPDRAAARAAAEHLLKVQLPPSHRLKWVEGDSHARTGGAGLCRVGPTASILLEGSSIAPDAGAAVRDVVTTSACLQQVDNAVEPKRRS